MAGIMVSTASTSTVVDLSRLSPPSIVPIIDFDSIVAGMAAQFAAAGFDALVESEPAMKLIEIAAYRELLLRQQFQDGALQLFVAYANGAALDHLAALVGVARLVIAPADPITGSAALFETDDALRQRIVLAPEGYSVAGPELAYVAHAKAASGDVLDASAISPAPGEVLVSVLSASSLDGSAPPELIATVGAVVADKAIRPLGDAVTTASAEIIPYAIDLALTTFSGPDVTLVIAAAEAGVGAYVADCRKLGRNVRRAGIEAAAKVEGVENVVLANPIADVLCDRTQAGHCTRITVTHAGYAD